MSDAWRQQVRRSDGTFGPKQGDAPATTGLGGQASAKQLRQLASAMLTRSMLQSSLRKTHGGDREIWESLGYPTEPDFSHYWDFYTRGDVAGTIVDAPAEESWKKPPEIVDPANTSEEKNDFEAAVRELFHNTDFEHFGERADKLAGVGRYTVLLIGTSEGDDLEAPIEEGLPSDPVPSDIVSLSPFREDHAEITEYVTDPTSKRRGKPEFYELTMFTGEAAQKVADAEHQKKVHASRVLHITDGALEDDVFGQPRLKRCLNRLIDLLKISGGSAEMFWANVDGIWHADIPADANVQTQDQAGNDLFEELEDQLQEAFHGVRRILQTRSMDLEHVGAGEPDPRGVWEILKALISAASRIPQRMLFGAEAGELASSQDEANWLARIERRRTKVVEPVIVRPFIDRMIELEVLPPPEGELATYEVNWPNLFELNEKEQAEVRKANASALKSVTDALFTGEVVTLGEARDLLGLPREKPDDETIENFRREEDRATAEAIAAAADASEDGRQATVGGRV